MFILVIIVRNYLVHKVFWFLQVIILCAQVQLLAVSQISLVIEKAGSLSYCDFTFVSMLTVFRTICQSNKHLSFFFIEQ